MALFSFSGQIISRGKSVAIGADGDNGAKANSLRSTSIAAAAYRSGSRLVDKRSGKVFDYSRKGGVVYTEIMLPPHAPGRYHDRATLWNAVEAAEKQVNSQLSRELRIALPSEFSREENIGLVRDFVQRNFVSKGMCADIAYHVKDHAGEDHNPHVHIMLTMRPMHKSGNWWETKSKKEYLLDKHGNRIVNSKGEYRTRNIDLTGWNDKGLYVSWREDWAKSCNELYAKHGLNLRIDHRSYKEQGIDRVATVHLGKEAAALERKGIATEKGEYNRAVNAFNEVAELGVEPVSLRATLKEIFLKAKERQRLSRKARGTEPAGEPHSTEKQARSQQAEPLGRSTKTAGEPAGRKSERRTDAPLHGAVRQGDPAPRKGDEKEAKKKPLRRLDKPTAAAVGERSYAQTVRSSIRHAEGTQNFLASRGAHSYSDILTGCRKANGEYTAAKAAHQKLLDEQKQLRSLHRTAAWYEENSAELRQLKALKEQSHDYYAANRDAILGCQYAEKKLVEMGYPVDATHEQMLDYKRQLAQNRNDFILEHSGKIKELQQLKKCAVWCTEHREISEQFEKVKLFKGRFYQNHKDAIDKFNFGKKTLEAAGFTTHHAASFFEHQITQLQTEMQSRQAAFDKNLSALNYAEKLISQRDTGKKAVERYEASKQLIDDYWQLNKKALGRGFYNQKKLLDAGYSPDTALREIGDRLKNLQQQISGSAEKLHGFENELRMWISCESYMRELLAIKERPADLPDFSVKAPNRRMSDLERLQHQLNKAAEQRELQQKEKSPREKSRGLER